MNLSKYAALSLITFAGFGSFPASAQTPSPAAAAPSPAAAAGAPSYDFGDGTSVTLTTKAWQALEQKDYAAVMAYTTKCIDTYKKQALDMQGQLKEAAPSDSANQYWALNDVGTCYYIQGQAYDGQSDKKNATEAYKFLADNLSFCQCWDPKGWFWSPADVAKKRLVELAGP